MGVYITQSSIIEQVEIHLKQVKTLSETINFSVNKNLVKY